MAIKPKINWLLILQGWAMLWVVVGHSSLIEPVKGPIWDNMLTQVAYSFHMPLFMLLSGWLFYSTRLSYRKKREQWSYDQIVKDKSLRLLLPGLVFSIVAFIVKIAFSGEMSRKVVFSFQDIIHAFLYPYDNPLRELWFIVTLYLLMILSPLWKLTLKKEWSIILTMIALLIIHFRHPDIELLCIGKVFNYAIWFYFGIVMSKIQIVEHFFKKYPWLILLFGLIIYATSKETNAFVTTLSGIVFSFGFALITDQYIPKLFFTFRNYTYQIFLMGIFAQILVKILYRHFNTPYLETYLLCVTLGIYTPVIISKIVERINWKPLSMCIGIK